MDLDVLEGADYQVVWEHVDGNVNSKLWTCIGVVLHLPQIILQQVHIG